MSMIDELRWKENMLITNDFGERVWLGPCIDKDGKRIGITDCCYESSPCKKHDRRMKQAPSAWMGESPGGSLLISRHESDSQEWKERGWTVTSLYSAPISPPSSVQAEAVAWLVIHNLSHGLVEKEVVIGPLTDDIFMDEGDEAIPLYAAPIQAPGIVAEGYVMVPKKLTAAMRDAGYMAAVSAGQMRESTIDYIWERMLSSLIKAVGAKKD